MSLVNMELSGKDFISFHNQTNTKFYKFLNGDLTHFGFTYGIGLNIDTVPFDPSGNCKSGGLYFCEKSKCHLYWRFYGEKIAIVEIPDDARVYIEDNKFKADKIIIKDILDFNSDNNDIDDVWIEILKNDSSAINYIKNQTPELCALAIQLNSYALKYIKNQYKTEDICKLAVEKNGNALKYVIDQTKELCALAVQQDPYALEYVNEQFQSEELCISAVSRNGCTIKYVKNQTPLLCNLAMKENSFSLQYVQDQTKELCILAVKKNGYAIQFVKNTDESFLNEIREIAIQYGGISVHKTNNC